MDMRHVNVGDATLEVRDWGSGEPVVFIQTALTADELLPMVNDESLAGGFRKVLYHRRGYAGSSRVQGPGSIGRDASDCIALLAALGIERAHIVGFSYSAAVGLELAANAPGVVHSLVLLEPPPVHTPSAPEFRAANERLFRTRHQFGADAAVDEFLAIVIGPNWRVEVERHLEGAGGQMMRDGATFIDTDLPALLAWRFGLDDAGRIGCPVLHVGGSDSGPWFAEVRELVLGWIPHAEDAVIDGADHSMTLTHTAQIADTAVEFWRRHPM